MTLQPTHVDHPSVGHELAMSWVTGIATANDAWFVIGPNAREVSAEFATGASRHMLEVAGLPEVWPGESLVVVGVEYYLQLQQLAEQFPAIQVAAARLLRLQPLAYNLRFLASTEIGSHEMRRHIERALLRTFDDLRSKQAPVVALAGVAKLLSTASEIPDIDVAVRLYLYEVDRDRPEKASRIRQEFEVFNPGLREQFESSVQRPIRDVDATRQPVVRLGSASETKLLRTIKAARRAQSEAWMRDVLHTLHQSGVTFPNRRGLKLTRVSKSRFVLKEGTEVVAVFEAGIFGLPGNRVAPKSGPPTPKGRTRVSGYRSANKSDVVPVVRAVRKSAGHFKGRVEDSTLTRIVESRSREGNESD